MGKTHDSVQGLVSYSFYPGKIFFIKLWPNVYLRETMCRTHDSATQDSRSQFKVMGVALEFRVRSISPLRLEGFSLNFGQMLIAVRRCAEPMDQLCRLNVKTHGHGVSQVL